MDTKTYLRQIYTCNQHIKQKEERLYELRQQAGGLKAITYDKDKVQSSPDDRISMIMSVCVDLETEIREDIIKLLTLKNKIACQIESMKNSNYERVLYLRYVSNYKWEDISKDMNKDLRWIYRLHGRALQEFAEIIDH